MTEKLSSFSIVTRQAETDSGPLEYGAHRDKTYHFNVWKTKQED